MVRKLTFLLSLLLLFCLQVTSHAKVVRSNFTVTNEMIYKELIELKSDHAAFKEKFKQIDRRFEELKADMNLRFANIDRKFTEMDKRFTEIDKRFTEINQKFNKIDQKFILINQRFDEISRRFKDINQRFDDMFRYLNILAAIFTTLTASVLAFAFWDRRTTVSRAKEEAVREIETSGKLISVLRERAKTDSELRQILKKYDLM